MPRMSMVTWWVLSLGACAPSTGTPPLPSPPAPAAVRFPTGSAQELALADELAHAWLDAHPDRAQGTWTTRTVRIDALATAHVRVAQHVDGVEVFGSQLIVHLGTDGAVRDVTDGSLHDIRVDPVPAYTADEAIDLAVEHTGGWDRVTTEPRAKQVVLRRDGVDALTWQVDVPRIDGTPASEAPRVFVDAHEGSVRWSYDNLQAFEPGGADTSYNGPIAFGVTYNGTLGAYTLLDERNGTYDFGTTVDSLFYIGSGSTTFAGDDAGPDAHYAVGVTLRYFETLGRNGPDGAWGPQLLEGAISSGVHYGTDVVNAYWDSVDQLMIFGDGDGFYSDPLTTLDVGAHEFTHAITEYSAGLVYANESGALNESMSDVFAAVVESDAGVPGTDRWLIGEQCWSPSIPDDALRFMNDPTLDGYSRDHYNDVYIGGFDNGGVHWNSGIANLAFQLLADGGSHPNPGKSVGVVNGIGIEDAGAIWYRALDVYLTPSATFAQARIATHRAAVDLFPGDPSVAESVLAAWAEVGLFAPDLVVFDVVPNPVAPNDFTLTSVTVPANATRLVVSIWGGTGDADLYLRRTSPPTLTNFVCRPYLAGNDESCTVNNPGSGTWWIGIDAFAPYDDLNLLVEITACTPGATEIAGNGFDEDCDGFDATCRVTSTGACTPNLAITELMVFPIGTGQATTGEYVEITNRSTQAIDLKGARLRKTTAPAANKDFSASLVLQPGEATVIAGSVDPVLNGGVKGVRTTLGTLSLPNTGGTLQLRSGTTTGATILDQVVYGASTGSGNAIPRGASLSVDPDYATPGGNDTATHWCDGRTPFGIGGFGTPGAPNDDCDWRFDFMYRYDQDGDGTEGEPSEAHGTTWVDFDFDSTSRFFTTGNSGTGGGLANPLNVSRGTTTGGQTLSFTYDTTGVTYTTTRSFGSACWPDGIIDELPPLEAVSGSFSQTGCVE